MKIRRTLPAILPLEPRVLFAAVTPSDVEQYLVELINRARANPAAEASRLGIDLNEGLAPGTISTDPKQPLAINQFLVDSARSHSQWMLANNTFSHTGANGTSPQDRMTNAGYVFTGSWAEGENIAYTSTSGSIQLAPSVLQNHNNLFIDSTVSDRGHRINLMDPDFREIGPGVATGTFGGLNATMVTEDFASTDDSIFLTGVAYNDAIAPNNFYTPGEGLGNVTVSAVRTSDNQTFSTTTTSSGGYSLPIQAGTYTVTASGGGLATPIVYSNVVVSTENVKRDFVPSGSVLASFVHISNGVLTIDGTSAADRISVTYSKSNYTVNRNGTSTTFSGADVLKIYCDAGDGDDQVVLDSSVIVPSYIYGGLGNDKLIGGSSNDTLAGGASKDTLFGGIGDDRLGGNGGNDRLYGEAGRDRLYGGDGNDILDGGSSTDRLWGEAGTDVYYGEGGNDYIYAKDNTPETIYGGTGTDTGQLDLSDTRFTLEVLLK